MFVTEEKNNVKYDSSSQAVDETTDELTFDEKIEVMKEQLRCSPNGDLVKTLVPM